MERLSFRLKQYFRKYRSYLRNNPGRLRVAYAVVGGSFTLIFLCVVALFGAVTAGLPDVTKLQEYDPAQTTKIYSRDGTLIATLFDQNRTPVTIDEISEPMKQAIVAIEDRRFYDHDGVDYRGIVRAALGNSVSGEVEQGASTLTMQLARRLFLDDERTYTRKLREAVLANRIDSTLTKDKILELYLNEVYFGSGAYGIDAAASVYFKVNPSELNLWQSALLAGLVQAPSAYSPIEDKKAAMERMDEVLQALVADGTISEQEREAARKSAANYKFHNNSLKLSDGMLKYPYFTTYAVKQLSEEFPENYIRRGGLQVYTTLDIDLQQAAEAALTAEVEGPGRQMGADAGAVVVLDNQTGQLLAMVGGTQWDTENQFNRAWQARRQPGSSFKMFVYAAALEAGFTPEHEFADTEAVFNYDTNPWNPANSDGRFMGPIPLRTGLQFSRNLVAAKVMAHVGPNRVITLAHKMGIKAELPEVVSLALGAGEISPLEMARAFSVLPNGGVLKKNNVFLKITDADGKLLKDFTEEEAGSRALSSNTATQMCEMLRRVVTGGTGTAANIPGTYIAGKTGTTDRFIDAWFVGFSPYHTISVWVGRDDNKPMGRVYGGTLPANVFRKVASHALQGKNLGAPLPGVSFSDPTSVELCWDSTYPALPGCSRTYHETFAAGIIPSRDCPMHRQMKKKVVVTKTEDGTLTNLTDDGLTVNTGLTVDRQSEDDSEEIDESLDPRKDPLVMTPAGAFIPYQEEEPEGKVKVVEIKLENKYPKTDPLTGNEISTDEEFVTDGEGRMIRVTEETAPDTGEDIVRMEVESVEAPDYPKADYPKADSGSSGESPRDSEATEVIYTNQNLEIPADPVDD
jgi:penicillin-binding protein 1A